MYDFPKSAKGTLTRPSAEENIANVARVLHRHIHMKDAPGTTAHTTLVS